ncbi:zinc-binding alcohol dehydrogenase family protein [Dactylosporangium cerinum]|uniref:Zinc-binding alcohol dehydrogenase family protein n=1 Tax=Dactylosporangium cerinum TaxID=1434730 RepID=A0ABV9WGQ5_9ACTN
MRVGQLTEFGQTPVVAQMEDPVPAPGEALVEVHMGALNPFDLRIASGEFYIRPSLPYVVGNEGVGVVLRSQRWPAGTRVRFGSSARPGGFAERVVVPDEQLTAVPDKVPDAVAAGIGVAGLAAWGGFTAGRLGAGDRVAVLGATGVVGRIAVQVARILGASRVVALGRDPGALETLAELGADASVAIDGQDPATLADSIVHAAGGPVNVVLDLVGGYPAQAAVMAAAPGARLVHIGDAAGGMLVFPSATLRSRSIEVRGYTNLALPPAEANSMLTLLLGHAESGLLRLEHDTVPLDELPVAWHRQGGSPHRKLVIALR